MNDSKKYDAEKNLYPYIPTGSPVLHEILKVIETGRGTTHTTGIPGENPHEKNRKEDVR